MPRTGKIPDLQEENLLLSQGYKYIAGVDEVGRGALAGPVVAAAVVLPQEINLKMFQGIRDSKLLSHSQREPLFDIIRTQAVSIGIGIIPCEVIDEINILNATRRAMKKAIEELNIVPDYLLIDGSSKLKVDLLQKAIVKGDGKCMSIACASIIAKVTRDRIMIDFGNTFPEYGFGNHKGYGTELHMTCLHRLGPSPIHRRTFAPVKQTDRLI